MAKETDATGAKKKNWFIRHKILTVLLAIIVIAIAAGGTDKKSNTSSNNASNSKGNQQAAKNKTYRFDDRLDKQEKDVEVLPGETATVDGVNMTVNSPVYKTALDTYTTAESGKTFLIIQVSLENKDNRTHSYNAYDFRVQTASGQVLDPYISLAESPLNSGDIVAGGKVSGSIVFQVPQEKANEYVIWKPNAVHSDRAIVQVKQQ